MFKSLKAIPFILMSANALYSNVAVPNTFSNGQVADANDVNQNFQTLADAINGLSGNVSSGNIKLSETLQNPVFESGNGFLFIPQSTGNISFMSSTGAVTDLTDGGSGGGGSASFPDGTLANPSFQFDTDNDTGLNFSGIGTQVDFVFDGISLGYYDSLGFDLKLKNGSLASPTLKLGDDIEGDVGINNAGAGQPVEFVYDGTKVGDYDILGFDLKFKNGSLASPTLKLGDDIEGDVGINNAGAGQPVEFVYDGTKVGDYDILGFDLKFKNGSLASPTLKLGDDIEGDVGINNAGAGQPVEFVYDGTKVGDYDILGFDLKFKNGSLASPTLKLGDDIEGDVGINNAGAGQPVEFVYDGTKVGDYDILGFDLKFKNGSLASPTLKLGDDIEGDVGINNAGAGQPVEFVYDGTKVGDYDILGFDLKFKNGSLASPTLKLGDDIEGDVGINNAGAGQPVEFVYDGTKVGDYDILGFDLKFKNGSLASPTLKLGDDIEGDVGINNAGAGQPVEFVYDGTKVGDYDILGFDLKFKNGSLASPTLKLGDDIEGDVGINNAGAGQPVEFVYDGTKVGDYDILGFDLKFKNGSLANPTLKLGDDIEGDVGINNAGAGQPVEFVYDGTKVGDYDILGFDLKFKNGSLASPTLKLGDDIEGDVGINNAGAGQPVEFVYDGTKVGDYDILGFDLKFKNGSLASPTLKLGDDIEGDVGINNAGAGQPVEFVYDGTKVGDYDILGFDLKFKNGSLASPTLKLGDDIEGDVGINNAGAGQPVEFVYDGVNIAHYNASGFEFHQGIGVNRPSPGSGSVDITGTYQTNGADYAEFFESEEKMVVGDVVGLNLETGLVRKYQVGDEFIGIISLHPAVIGNGNADKDTHALVGLVGQLDVDKDQIVLDGRKVYTLDGEKIGVMLKSGKVFIR